MAKIDSQRAALLIARACGPYETLGQAMVAGRRVQRERDEAVEICMPYAGRLVNKLIVLPAQSRVEYQDLEGAALLGLVEAIDSFEHRRGVQIQTHCYFRMFKRICDERAQSHWTTAKPPRALIDKFMSGRMTPEEQQSYIVQFVGSWTLRDDKDMESWEAIERYYRHAGAPAHE